MPQQPCDEAAREMVVSFRASREFGRFENVSFRVTFALMAFAAAVTTACDNRGEPAALEIPRADADASRTWPNQIEEMLAATRTRAFLVLEDDAIVFEWYARRADRTRLHPLASLSKAAVGSTVLALALDEGLVDLDDPVSRHIPRWSEDPLRSSVTIRQLANHSSGIPHGKLEPLAGWRKAFWRREPELFQSLIDEAPITFEPGSEYEYSGPAYGVLSYVLSRAHASDSGQSLEELLRARVMRPLAIPDGSWSMSYGRAFSVGTTTVHATWSGATFQARSLARMGQLFAHLGSWNGRQIIRAETIESLVRYHDAPLPRNEGPRQPAPALGWWSNALGAWPALPPDAYAAAGSGGQILLVIPSRRLVLVRLGMSPGTADWGGEMWTDVYRNYFTLIDAGA